MKVLHSWLTDYLGDEAPAPEKIEGLLTFHSFEIDGVEKVGDETVIDVDVLPNRGSDCLCHRGIAREIAALLDVRLVDDPLAGEVSLPETDQLAIEIADSSACRRMSLALMEGVKVQESPSWLRLRLEALGQRSINNIVDATNYVMLAIGQPLHAYDAGKFEKDGDVWRFGARFARADEEITTLTGDTHTCDPRVQLIVNAKNDAPAGIAGIKGGAYAAIDEATTTIVLEAANFDPAITRKASQSLRLQTDASKRFENEPSRELTAYALQAVSALIKDIAGGEIVGWQDAYAVKQESVTVPVRVSRTNALLGLSLTAEEVESILARIGAVTTPMEGGFLATGPWERADLLIEEDFIEEIGRVHGYTHVVSVAPEPAPLREINARHYYSERVRQLLIEHGFSEVITSSFRKKDEIQLANALASDKSYMRSTLRANIADALQKNAPNTDLLGVSAVRLFEIGTVFDRGEGTVGEHTAFALGVRHKASGPNKKDDEVIAAAVAALEATLGTSLVFDTKDGIAECDFSKAIASLQAPQTYGPVTRLAAIQYRPFSTFPFVSRDIALWVSGEVSAADVEQVLNDAAGELRVKTTLFDEFSKDGRTSYAFRLVFQSNKKTLTDSEVNKVMDQVYAAANESGWEVR